MEWKALVGVGVANLACTLAKRAHAPDLEMVYESGAFDSHPSKLPLSIGDPVLATSATGIAPMVQGFEYSLQAGRIDVGFLGGAQIDPWGTSTPPSSESTTIPPCGCPGAGDACEIASNTHRTIVVTPHTRRRFPEEVDVVTSPGYVDGRATRKDLDLRGGPAAVITDDAVLGFDETGETYVESLHPGVDRETVQDATGWDLQFSSDLATTTPPSAAEIDLIRTELDPDGVYIGATEE